MPAADDGDESDAVDDDSAPVPRDDHSKPGVPATPRNRAKSAGLWGLVGGFLFLVLVQGFLLWGGDLPFAYVWLFVVAAVVAAVSGGMTYLVELRVAKRRT